MREHGGHLPHGREPAVAEGFRLELALAFEAGGEEPVLLLHLRGQAGRTLAQHMKEAGHDPDAVRARVTAAAVAKALGSAEEIRLERRLYLASPGDIVAVVRSVPASATTAMIVGHNPGLEELVEQLTGERRQDLPTAALAQIALPIDQWRDLKLSTRGALLGHWRPKELT